MPTIPPSPLSSVTHNHVTFLRPRDPRLQGFAHVAAWARWAFGNTCFSLGRAGGFSAFGVPTAASRPAKPSNLFSCDSSGRRGQSPSPVSSRADLLRPRGHVPFYPINTVNFPDPFLHFFPPNIISAPPHPHLPQLSFRVEEGEVLLQVLGSSWPGSSLCRLPRRITALSLPAASPGGKKTGFFLADGIKITWIRPSAGSAVLVNLSLSTLDTIPARSVVPHRAYTFT